MRVNGKWLLYDDGITRLVVAVAWESRKRLVLRPMRFYSMAVLQFSHPCF